MVYVGTVLLPFSFNRSIHRAELVIQVYLLCQLFLFFMHLLNFGIFIYCHNLSHASHMLGCGLKMWWTARYINFT